MTLVETWAAKIRPHLEQSVASIIEAGHLLIDAKAELPHGSFGPLLDDLGIGQDMAQRFMRVSRHPLLSNPAPVQGLPPSVSVLDVLARMEPDELEEAIDRGDVTPATTRKEAERLTRPEPVPRPADPVDPIDPTEAGAIEDELHAAHDDDVTDEDRLEALEDNAESKRLPEPKPRAEPPRKRDVGGGLHHPAPYSDALLALFRDLLAEHAEPGAVVLDPFAGTGRIHELRPTYDTVGVELEPEWAGLSPHTFIGDATGLDFDDDEMDAIVTSPTYGNRLADAHAATDPERRRSYTHDLGRKLSAGNSGGMQWGDEYRILHDAAWCEARRVLRPGGLFLLNIKDHVRNGKRVRVAGWHVTKLVGELGFEFLEEHRVETRGLMAGANHDVRTGAEMVYVLRLADR